MRIKPQTGIKAALITFNNHLGRDGLMEENDNSVLIIQGPGQLGKNCSNLEKKKLDIVRAALRRLKSRFNEFEKIIVYVGEGLISKIIKIVSECGLPAEKVLFLVSESDWGNKENETLISSRLASAKVVKYQENTSDVIWSIYRSILRDGMLPQ